MIFLVDWDKENQRLKRFEKFCTLEMAWKRFREIPSGFLLEAENLDALLKTHGRYFERKER